MPYFEYKARNHRGEAVQGRIEALSVDAVATQLIHSGVNPISIREIQEGKVARGDIIASIRKRFFTPPPSLDDLILFCRQMYTLTRSGIPLLRGISGLAETTHNPVLADALRKIRQEVETGRELATAMAQFPNIFSTLMVSTVRVGESTGSMDDSFQRLSGYLELERDTRTRIKMALRYPIIVLVVMAVAITVINILVIPAFANVFASMKANLPWQTRALIATSDFFVSYWPIMLTLLGAAVYGLRRFVRTERGRYEWDKRKLRLPIVGGIINRATLSRFANGFAMTSRSGVPLPQALSVVARSIDNEYVSEKVTAMRNGVERGDSLTRTATAANLFTPLVLQMMAVGEETGNIDTMMEEVAHFYEREVDYDLKNLTSAIEPILISIVAGLVLILALGVFLPMWELTQMAHQ